MNIDYQISIIVNIYLAIAIFQSIKPLPQLTINEKIETLNIKFLRRGEVATTYKASLIAFSTICYGIYGEAVNLARVMANTYDPTYFDIYDDCPEQIIEPRTKNTIGATVIVVPNPSNGNFTLYYDRLISGELRLIDMLGKVLYSQNVSNVLETSLNFEINPGTYLINILSEDGLFIEEKLVIVR